MALRDFPDDEDEEEEDDPNQPAPMDTGSLSEFRVFCLFLVPNEFLRS